MPTWQQALNTSPVVDEGVQVVEAAEQRVGDLPALRGAGAAAVEEQLRVVHALGAQAAAQPPGGRVSKVSKAGGHCHTSNYPLTAPQYRHAYLLTLLTYLEADSRKRCTRKTSSPTSCSSMGEASNCVSASPKSGQG